MPFRIDASARPTSAQKTAFGFLRGVANVTRTGVFVYRNADGSERRELRHPEDVFATDSIDSLKIAPVTLDHPKEAVTAANARDLAVGSIGESVERAPGDSVEFVRAGFQVFAADAVDAIDAGKRELSCAYNCDLETTPGTFNGERFDGRQRNIRYNHVAIVDRGRAGKEVAVPRMDSGDAVEIEKPKDAPRAQEGPQMIKIRIDGVDYEVSEQTAQVFRARMDRADADLAKAAELLKALQAEHEKVTGRADALAAENKTLKEAAHNATSPATVAKLVAARVSLVTSATKVLGADAKLDSMSDDEIKRAVVVKVSPECKLDGKSAEYIAARFDHAVETYEDVDGDETLGKVNAAASRADAGVVDANVHRQKMLDRNRELFTKHAAK